MGNEEVVAASRIRLGFLKQPSNFYVYENFIIQHRKNSVQSTNRHKKVCVVLSPDTSLRALSDPLVCDVLLQPARMPTVR